MSEDRKGGNYYDDQFGDRIRDIGRGGSSPPPSSSRRGPSGSGNGGKVAGGMGGIIVMAAVLGGMRACNTSTRTNYNYTPPPQIQFQPPPQFQFQPPPPFVFDPPPQDDLAEIRRLLREQPPIEGLQLPPGIPVVPAPPERRVDAKGSPLFQPEDVAYLPALCYLLHKEGHHTTFTPSRRLFDRLDIDARKLLREIAMNPDKEPEFVQRDEILEALNKVLDDVNFYDARYFRDVQILDVELRASLTRWTNPTNVKTQAEARRINRALLEAAYPEQILSRDLQPLADADRQKARKDARKQLSSAKKMYDDKEP